MFIQNIYEWIDDYQYRESTLKQLGHVAADILESGRPCITPDLETWLLFHEEFMQRQGL